MTYDIFNISLPSSVLGRLALYQALSPSLGSNIHDKANKYI